MKAVRLIAIALLIIMVIPGATFGSSASGTSYPQSFADTAYENSSLSYYYLSSQSTTTDFQSSTPTNSTQQGLNENVRSGLWTASSSFESYSYPVPAGAGYVAGSAFNQWADWAFQAGYNYVWDRITKTGIVTYMVGIVTVDLMSGGTTVASWSHNFDWSSTTTSSGWVYINPTFSFPSGSPQPITAILFNNSAEVGWPHFTSIGGGGLIDFAEATANDNSIGNSLPDRGSTIIGWRGYTTPTNSASWTVPSETQSYTISWSAPYPAVMTYNGNTQFGTSGSFTGVVPDPTIYARMEYWVSGTQTIDTKETFSVATQATQSYTSSSPYVINQQTSNASYYDASFSFSFAAPGNAMTGNSLFPMVWTTSVSHLEDVYYSSSGTGDSWSYTLSPGSTGLPSGGTYRSLSNSYSTTSGGTLTWSFSSTEIVNPEISASITSAQNPTDIGVNVTFYGYPSQRIPPYTYTYLWSINGHTYTTQNVTVQFPASGGYSVDLTVTDTTGFSSSAVYSETVNSDPVVSTSSNVSAADIGYPVEFYATPSGGTSPYNVTWTLNGNVLSYSRDFPTSFSSPGTYSLIATVRDAVGASSSSTASVTVNPNPSVSTAATPSPTDIGKSVSFSSRTSGGTGTMSYDWTVNGVSVSSTTSLLYTFQSYGMYYVNLTVKDSDGHSYTAVYREQVNNDTTAVISSTPSPTEPGVATNFTAAISGGTSPYNYTWSVNGSIITYRPYMIYTFGGPANYKIELRLADASGYVFTTTTNENASKPPSVSVTSDFSQTDVNTSFNVSSFTSGGTAPYSYSWSISGPASQTFPGYNRSYLDVSESVPGSYEIYLTVTDYLGLSSSSSTQVTVVPDPSSSFTVSLNPVDANLTDRLTASVSNGTGPYSYEWIIGGVSSSGAVLDHSFSAPGNYPVQLIASDVFGKDATSAGAVKVIPDPVVSVRNSSLPTASEPVAFNATVSGGQSPYSVLWIFPGGQQEAGFNVSQVFATSGPTTYEIQITDRMGFVLTENFTINVRLYITVSATITSGLSPLTASFSESVLGGSSYAYAWNFGNGNSSVSQSPTEIFQEGNYSITLTVTSANGATGSRTIEIRSLPPPVSVVYRPSTGITVLSNVSFRAIPNWDASGPYNASWTFPDGQTLTGMNVSYQSAQYVQTYQVTLAFEYNGTLFTKIITVSMATATPVISLLYPRIVPTGSVIRFDASNSSSPDASISEYQWSFTGKLFYGSIQYFDFRNAGNYSITLTVKDSLGASASENFTVEAEAVGTNSSIVIAFTSSSQGPITTYTISTDSPGGYGAVEAFMSSQLLPMTLLNESGRYRNYSITLDQANYNSGSYPIDFIVFSNASGSNSVTIPFVVSAQYALSSFNLVAMFGGMGNFLIFLVTVIGTAGGLLAYRGRGGETIDINGTILKGKPGGDLKMARRRKPAAAAHRRRF